LFPEPWFYPTNKEQLLQDAYIFSCCLVVKANLTANLREVSELARAMRENLYQPRHLVEFFHVGDFAHIPLHDGSDVIACPYLAPLWISTSQHFGVAARQHGSDMISV
jgi:hypothetical protein